MQAIPEDNIRYPVLVKLSNDSSASGFFLNGKNGSYFITAKHVFFDEEGAFTARTVTLTAYSSVLTEAKTIDVTLDLQTLLAGGRIKSHPTADVAVVGILVKTPEGFGIPPGAQLKLPGQGHSLVGVSIGGTKKYSEVLISNEVYVFGYPASLGIKNRPQIDFSRPLLRRGAVAGKNDANQTIVLDCPVYYGNSGGPVIEAEQVDLTTRRFSVIGVVSEFVPFVETWYNIQHKFQNVNIENSGYSVVVPMDQVFELVEPWENAGRETAKVPDTFGEVAD